MNFTEYKYRFAAMRIIAGLMVLCCLVFVGCENSGSSGSYKMTSVSLPNRGPVYDWSDVDMLVNDAVRRKEFPGAVLLVGRGDEILLHRAYGNRAVEPKVEPMTKDTVFDLASLTKSISTATAVMKLVEQGKIDPEASASEYLKGLDREDKKAITVEQLLVHRSGYAPGNSLKDYPGTVEGALENIYKMPLRAKPGEKFAYTDLGFILLGAMVEEVSGKRLDVFMKDNFFEPLGMKHTAYNPPEAWAALTAPTEKRDGKWMRGEVHDPRAYRLGGVAGHAGLFSTAGDLAVFCQMLVNGGQYKGKQYLKSGTIKQMVKPRWWSDRSGSWGYGYMTKSPYDSARGYRFDPSTTFGHTGFTGTSFWVDPVNKLYVIFLANRVHPNGKGSVLALRRALSTTIADKVLGPDTVLTGIDVLRRSNFKELAGRRVGLITNHTGLTREGTRTIDALHRSAHVKLVKIFSPEHGIAGKLEGKVGHATDERTKLPIYSLYGESRKPTKEMLADIDTLVFDIQDIGTRFYTYISTMGNVMEAAGEHGKRVVILDRPNPVTGVRVGGPLIDKDMEHFIAYHPIPLVHGMTVGELARLFNKEREINCELEVIKMKGWRRGMWYEETGLAWVNPSPNMRNLTQATTYPAIGMLEFTNLSVGRGTDQPFELFGAAWINPEGEWDRLLTKELNGLNLPGIKFVPITFTPDASKFKDEVCGGCYLFLTNRNTFNPELTGLAIAKTLQRLFPEQYDHSKLMTTLRDREVYGAWLKTDDARELPATWQEELSGFMKTRAKYLLYD